VSIPLDDLDSDLSHGLIGFSMADLLANDEIADVLSRKSADDRWVLHDAPTAFAVAMPVWGNA
jgi:hypothetical protein